MLAVALLLCQAALLALLPLRPKHVSVLHREEKMSADPYFQEWALSGCRRYLATHVNARPIS